MKNLLKLLVCASLIFNFQFSILNSSQAQNGRHSQGRLDENATEALKKAEKRLLDVSGTVTLTMLDSHKKQTAKQSAKVQYCRGMYHLTMSNQEIYCDGSTIWQWNKEAKEIVINNMPPASDIDLLNPGRLIANYAKNFRVKYIRSDNDGSAVIDMQPRSAQSYHKIRLFVNEETGELKRMEVHKYDSSREIYEFSGMSYSPIKGSFTFNPADHPEAEVIDMR